MNLMLVEIESGSWLRDSDRDSGSLEFYLTWIGENMLIVDLNLAKSAYYGHWETVWYFYEANYEL